MQAVQTETSSRRVWAARLVERSLAECDIQLGGARPFDIRVSDPAAFRRIVRAGSLGFGESYMDGQWDCERIDMLFERLLRHRMQDRFSRARPNWWLALEARLINLQSRARAKMVATQHYDIGNDLYEHMLDPWMNYSCGYWLRADTLEQAQQHKMELICRKLELEPGMKLLDIGCGWGGMARYAAERYGVHVVGVTISEQQQQWAEKRVRELPVEIRCQDYREVDGTFDRIVSIGMFEHVGYKNYLQYFQKCHEVLRENGLMLLHTIGSNRTSLSIDPWLHRYIFPNGILPSIAQIGGAIEPYFVMEDWHNFGVDYDRTLMAWYERIEQAWGRLDARRYDERFRRMWRFYLLACAGAFRARHTQLWQVVLSKGGRPGAYRRPALD